jgi:pimeloyl-ACP methyl ester carboxylesterase
MQLHAEQTVQLIDAEGRRVGQIVAIDKQHLRLSREFALQQARERQEKEAIDELEALGTLPWGDKVYLENFATLQQWVDHFGGMLYGETSNRPLFRNILVAPEYSLGDLIKFARGVRFSVQTLFLLEVRSLDLRRHGPRFDVPVYFFEGRHDWVAPSVMAEQYFETIEAPCKKLVWFEKSAHAPPFEEPERFVEALVEHLLRTG